MKEDFIQNIQFDLFSVELVVGDLFSIELVIGETATLLLAEKYVQDTITELRGKTNEEINKLLPLIYAGL